MTERFEVGQKVTHALRGDAEVTYGPFISPIGQTRYILRLESGGEYFSAASDIAAIPETPAFSVGDKVTYSTWGVGEVKFGPYIDIDEEVYLVKFANGRCAGVGTQFLKSVDEPVKVGDRVRVTDDDCGGRRFGGRVGVVKRLNGEGPLRYTVEFGDGRGSHGDENGRWNCRSVERIEDTYEYNGVVYDLAAKYRDRDGDSLKIAVIDGIPRVAWFGCEPADGDDTLSMALAQYGPFTRVTD